MPGTSFLYYINYFSVYGLDLTEYEVLKETQDSIGYTNKESEEFLRRKLNRPSGLVFPHPINAQITQSFQSIINTVDVVAINFLPILTTSI